MKRMSYNYKVIYTCTRVEVNKIKVYIFKKNILWGGCEYMMKLTVVTNWYDADFLTTKSRLKVTPPKFVQSWLITVLGKTHNLQHAICEWVIKLIYLIWILPTDAIMFFLQRLLEGVPSVWNEIYPIIKIILKQIQHTLATDLGMIEIAMPITLLYLDRFKSRCTPMDAPMINTTKNKINWKKIILITIYHLKNL